MVGFSSFLSIKKPVIFLHSEYVITIKQFPTVKFNSAMQAICILISNEALLLETTPFFYSFKSKAAVQKNNIEKPELFRMDRQSKITRE